MDYKELKTKTESQLHEMLHEKRDELRGVRFKVSAGALKDTMAPRRLKKTIARILTVLKKLQEEKNTSTEESVKATS